MAAALSDFAEYFKLMKAGPNFCGYILNHFMDRERKLALKVLVNKYVNVSIIIITFYKQVNYSPPKIVCIKMYDFNIAFFFLILAILA